VGQLELILIGYWKGENAERWPDPAAFVDHGWDELERDDVARYLTQGFVARTWMGYSPCRFCGKSNGAIDLTDGVYLWPEGFAHYVEDHGVRPPAEFVEHVLAMMERFDSMRVDDSWWLSQRRGGRGGRLGERPAEAQ
jgi:hypothetical protein